MMMQKYTFNSETSKLSKNNKNIFKMQYINLKGMKVC